MKRNLIIGLIVLVAIAAGIAVTAFVVDVHNDRQYTVKITGNVRVYDKESPPGYTRGDEGVIEIVHPNDRVDVLRIYSHDDYQAMGLIVSRIRCSRR